ncbi:glycosyltransferase [Bifidobacterium vansinderenii]|uniref:Glycosyl transferase family 2 n=1 Tax=Bifidobacterium vansinderenii TaxID=1984871 RepID=A0A229VV40_9BIFI|nr:glycosyltransferase [Bifidobacterium vansinderenii]OXM99405.1 glycosyl transferase family 2 [Bifidobacterium vansinderenii]
MADSKSDSASRTWETVVRIVYPTRDADLTMPLYAIDWTPQHLSETMLDSRIDMKTLEFGQMNESKFQHLVRGSVAGVGASGGVRTDSFTVTSRDEIRVTAGQRTSLCTFFNAFPASYWRRWTRVDSVRFVATASGTGRVLLYRSNGRGLSFPVATITVEGSGSTKVARNRTIAAEVPMTDLMDGGYFWFDAEASSANDLTITHAAWQVPQDRRVADANTTLSIAIATFNRPSYCLNQLVAMSEATELRKRLDTIYCTDQGTDLVQNQTGFPAVAKELGPQLTYIRQRNLGGSGGFSRGMFETVEAGKSTYCLLLDDDAISEPEAILRALQFSDYTVRPTLVGGGMLHLDNRTVLYSQGERVDWYRMWMVPSRGMGYNHDFSVEPLRDAPERHQRVDEDFNGWWMCMIPVAVLKKIGLSLPVFIKFDDIEYGLRAKRAGFPTVCLPGVAVWHQAWHGKDNARTWEEYFTNRNRWIAALMLKPEPSRRVIFENLYSDASLGLRFIYSAMALRHQALRDILRGPQYIVDCLPTKLGEMRELRGQFTDAQAKPSFDDFPEPDHELVSPRYRPQGAKARRKGGIRQIVRSLMPGRRARVGAGAKPDVAITAQDTAWTWLAFAGIDSALVTTPDGNSVAWFKRDNPRFRKSMWEGYRLASELVRNWKRLSAEYRAYDLPSIETWRRIFAVDKAAAAAEQGGDSLKK